jgi:alpha-tubulin suppressor-like RCC1 family protein
VGFVLAPDTTTLLLRETAELSGLSINSAGGRTSVTATEVQWESSNPGVASVNSTGAITGIAAGSATITGHWSNYSSSARVTVVQVAFETMSAGRTHTCALTPAGATYCWGANDFGQAGRPGLIGGSLGGPATVFYSTPTRVADNLAFVGVTAGGFHSCALTAGGVAYCWGYNGLGSLGSDNFADSWRPVGVTGGLNFVAIDAGTYHTCGLTSGGIAYCWGSNRSGQLGTSGPISSSKPLVVAGGLAFASLSAGGSHTCGVTTNGVAYCWGENAGGQLGVGENVTSSSTPLPVSGGLAFSSVSAGDAHTCGVTRSGSLYCWGWNFDNQLGNGTSYTPSAVPVAVASSLSFIAVGGGTSHTCALDASGAAYCWGQNLSGQIGLGTATPELFATPQRVAGGLAFGKLSVGRSHTCAVTVDGLWYCWGNNESGVLGVGTITNSGTPAKVLGQQ